VRKDEAKPVRFSKAQLEAITFRAPRTKDGLAQVEVAAFLGEYGGGKTFAAAHRFVKVCSENPHQTSGVSAPTATGLINGPLAAFFSVCPESWIKKNRARDTRDPHILLRNGHKIILYTGRGALDGPNLCQFWADEIQDKCYEGQWANMAGRVRVRDAARLNAQASGIAQLGHVADLFRNPPRDGRHITKLLFPEDNARNLAAGYVDTLKAASAGGRKRDPDGWMTPDGLVYAGFSKERNIDPIQVPRETLRRRPTDLAIDLGYRAAVTFWQGWGVECSWGAQGVRKEMGQVCVDQMMPDDKDAEEIAKIILDHGRWNIVPGVSKITLDPTAERDQVRWFRRAFPGVDIIQHRSGDYWLEDNGIRATERAVLDAHGSVRLFVHRDLVGDHDRGVVEAFRGYKRDKLKDKWFEHAADTARYQCATRLPLPHVRVEEKKSTDIDSRMEREFRPIAPKFGEVTY